MVLHIHARRVRTKYEKRKRTLLKKLWEFFTFCHVDFHILMVNGTEVTIVTAGNYQLPTEEMIGDGFTVERLNIQDLERTYGRTSTASSRNHISSGLDMEDSADDLNMEDSADDLNTEYSTDGTDLEDLTEDNNIWDIVVPEPPT